MPGKDRDIGQHVMMPARSRPATGIARSHDLNEGVVIVSLLADSIGIPFFGKRVAARPKIPQDTAKFAEAAGIHPYVVLCGISARVPRKYIYQD